MALTLFICGVVELNLGPKRTKSSYNFFLFLCNLKNLLAHDFSKLSWIEAYNTHHNFDTICLSGTYLEFFHAIDDPLLNFKDFTLIRADNPHNWKRAGASICFKEYCAARPVNSLNLNECLGLESNIQNKKGYVISLSQSPSQNKDLFDQFILNFEQHISDRMIQNPLSTLVICNFKVR